MSTDFSVLDIALGDDKSTSEIVSVDLQYRAEGWRKENRRRNITRRVQNVDKEQDQQTLPRPCRKNIIVTDEDPESEPEELPEPEEQEDTSDDLIDDGVKMPQGSLLNALDFSLIKQDRTAKPIPRVQPQQAAAQQMPVRTAVAQPPQARPYYQPSMMQRPYTPQQPLQQQQAPQQQDESNHQIPWEAFFIKLSQQQQQQQQQRQENDTRYLTAAPVQQMRPGMNAYAAAHYQQQLRMMGSHPQMSAFLSRAGYSQPYLQTAMQPKVSRPPSVYPQQQQVPTVLKTYINKNTGKSEWGIIDPDTTTPVILDKDDLRFKFTEGGQRNGEKRTVRQWNNLNLENKDYHVPLYVSSDSRLSLDIQHSAPALNMSLIEPRLKEEDYLNYHHPKLDTEPFIKFGKVRVTFEPDLQTSASPWIKDLDSLSGRRGEVVVIEHTSESLVYILNVGMASKLITYYHKATPSDFPKQEKAGSHVGNLHILEPDQKSPFSAEIPRSELVHSINCLLYSIPLAEHDVRETDFLLIKDMRKMEFYIRRFRSIYCGGYLEPRVIVLRPATKDAQDFHMSFIKAVLVNIFRGTEQYKGRRRIQVSQIQQEFFPGVNDPKLRTVLHGFAKFYREQGNGFWERKDDANLDVTFQRIKITPEDVCRYQSMLVGQWKLRQNGVNILTKSKRVFQQIQNLRGELTKRVAGKIEIELMKTPWARTENFTKAFQGHAVQIQHTEDGQQIVRSQSRRGKVKRADGKDPPVTTRRPLAGTRSDLRKLTLVELRDNLLQLGTDPREIDGLDRWAQVDLLRQLCNRQKQDGTESELTANYARGPRNDYAASLDAYKKQYQTTFDNNLIFIKTKDTDANEAFDDGNILDELSLMMEREERDGEDGDEDFELPGNEGEKKPVLAESHHGDPPELKPGSIYVSPSKIDWDQLGFAGYPRRKVAKFITISWTREEGLHVKLDWRRSPHQIENMMKLPYSVYPDQGQKAPTSNEDLEEYLLKTARKGLLDKVRRTRQAIKSKGVKAQVQSYIAVHHQLPFVNDTGGNHLTFRLTADLIQKVEDASERFAVFEKRTGRSHGKKKKTSVVADHASDDDSDDTSEVVRVPKKRIGRQSPVVLFNELLKKLLSKLLQRPGDAFWPFKKPVLKKDVPDYYNIIFNPMCFEDIERKANNLEYTTIAKFYADVKQIETNCRLYNTPRTPELVALGEKMMECFEEELRNFREELDQKEAEIDPILRSQSNFGG